MKNIIVIILAIGIPLTLGGCASYPTSSGIQQSAADLKPQVDDLKNTAQQQLQNEDQKFRDESTQLLAEIQQLSDQENIDLFNLDGQRAADDILINWQNNTLPGKFRDRFYSMMTNHVQLIIDENAAMDAARTNYAGSYKQIKLSLDSLNTIDSDLAILSKPDGGLTSQDISSLLSIAAAVGQNLATNSAVK